MVTRYRGSRTPQQKSVPPFCVAIVHPQQLSTILLVRLCLSRDIRSNKNGHKTAHPPRHSSRSHKQRNCGLWGPSPPPPHRSSDKYRRRCRRRRIRVSCARRCNRLFKSLHTHMHMHTHTHGAGHVHFIARSGGEIVLRELCVFCVCV